MQCAYLPGKAVIPLDYDDSFGLEYPTFNAALRGNEMDELIIKYQLENAWRHNLDMYFNICIDVASDYIFIVSLGLTVYCLPSISSQICLSVGL